jgi:hypothetical protein
VLCNRHPIRAQTVTPVQRRTFNSPQPRVACAALTICSGGPGLDHGRDGLGLLLRAGPSWPGLARGDDAGRLVLRSLAVLKLADPGASPDNAAALADFPVLTLVEGPIRRRKALAAATARGLTVDELTPVDPKAIQELDDLAAPVFNH